MSCEENNYLGFELLKQFYTANYYDEEFGITPLDFSNPLKYELQKGCHVSDDLQSAFDEAFEFRIRKLKPENNLDEKALEWLDNGLVFLKQE